MSKYRVVLVNTSSVAEAEKVARILVKKGLAACVNIVPKIRSIYRWKGEIEEERETLLIIKTKKEFFTKLKKTIRKVHSYETPEIVSLKIEEGDKSYLEWIDSVLK